MDYHVELCNKYVVRNTIKVKVRSLRSSTGGKAKMTNFIHIKTLIWKGSFLLITFVRSEYTDSYIYKSVGFLLLLLNIIHIIPYLFLFIFR